jgi:hypothetical protein
MEINPQKLEGHWNEGWALDLHTSSSHPIKDEDGNITGWDTKRPPVAEELYRLKYWKEQYRAAGIAKPASEFLDKYKSKWQIDLIIPIPPSETLNSVATPPMVDVKAHGIALFDPSRLKLMAEVMLLLNFFKTILLKSALYETGAAPAKLIAQISPLLA